MAFAHICHCCGTDLSRIRGVRHRDFGLPIVQCPSCCTHIVRRLIAHRTPGKRVRRACSASWIAIRNLALLAFVTAAHLLGASTMAEPSFQRFLESFSFTIHRLEIIFPVLVFPVLSGVTLFSVFRHIRILWLVAGWWLYAVLWLVALHTPEIVNDLTFDPAPVRLRQAWQEIGELSVLVGTSTAILGIELLGAIPGILLARVTMRGRRVRRARRRRKSRMNRGRTS